MFQDAELYHRHHKFTAASATKLMDYVVAKMSFEVEDVVMDIGCGPGDNTKDIILARIPKLKKLVAIDVEYNMIDFSKSHQQSKKIEYHVADIQDMSSLQLWEGLIPKVISVHCFHFVKNQEKGFQSLYNLLKPRGEAAFVFILSSGLWDCFPGIINDKKWNKYLKDADQQIPQSHLLSLGEEYYRQLFEDIGFEVLHCIGELVTQSYDDEVEFRSILPPFSGLSRYIPDELQEEFMDEFFSRQLELCNRNSDGCPTVWFKILTVHLKKH